MRKRTFLGLLVLSFLLSSCSTAVYESGQVGALGGATAGALIDKNNRWRGAVIGGVLGGVVGGAMGSIAERAARESAYSRRPVQYTSEDYRQKVYAEPVRSRSECTTVRTTYYLDSRIVKIEEREVCH